MRKYAASIAKRKGIKPPRGYTKSAAVCRAFLDEHVPRQSRGQSTQSPADGPAPGAPEGGKPESAGKRARRRKPGQQGKFPRAGTEPPSGVPQPAPASGTPLRIPYGNKELAFRLGAIYGADGWYAPPGVDLAGFRERGWL